MTNVHVTLKIKKDSFEIKPLVLDLPVFLSWDFLVLEWKVFRIHATTFSYALVLANKNLKKKS